MANIVGIIFPNETNANRGLQLLGDLEEKGELSMSGCALATKDKSGAVSFRSVSHLSRVGWTAAMAGAFLGGLAGLIAAGPVLAAVGAVTGALFGTVADTSNLDDRKELFDAISRRLKPGNAVILANIEERVEHSMDPLMAAIGGVIIRT